MGLRKERNISTGQYKIKSLEVANGTPKAKNERQKKGNIVFVMGVRGSFIKRFRVTDKRTTERKK